MSLFISVKVVDVDTNKVVKSSTGEDAYKVTYPDGYISSVLVRVFNEKKYVPVSESDLKLISEVDLRLINNYE